MAKKLLPAIVVCLILSIFPSGAATRHLAFVKTHVRFLATSTSVRTFSGESQDVYLVEIDSNDIEPPTLARLVDEYPPYRTAFPVSELTTPAGITLILRRDHGCDMPIGKMPLRTAPGDPRATLPEKLGFQIQTTRRIAPDESIPCYRTVRK